MALLASRLADIEHKGSAYKQLKTLRSTGSLYHAKALCGGVIVAALVAAQFLLFALYGFFQGYKGAPDPGYYLASAALQLASCLSLFFLQLLLSMLFANQMIALVAGLGGSMAALLLMFVSRHSFLPWGGTLSAALVGMDWDPKTRFMSYYYRDFSPVEQASVACIFVWLVVFYMTGRILFSRREK